MAETPQQAVGAFNYSLQIGDALFELAFRWNTRFRFWTCDLYDAGGNALVLGRKIILGQPIFADINMVVGMPSMMLVALDNTGSVVRIERNDLGNAVGIYAV